MPGKTKQDECEGSEQAIKEHAYYYDDAHGYEEYDPKKEEEKEDDAEEDQSAPER